MNKKFGLGKGLGALIPDEIDEEVKESINQIDINMIKANEEQPRKNFDKEKILQLAESIKDHGIIQPIILKKSNDTYYTIIAGERRWRAAKLIGLKEIPAVIMDLTEKQVLEISLIENIQREDLNPIEEALAYKKLVEDFELTQEEVARRIGRSRTSVTNILRLLNLDKRVQDYLVDGVITEGHGRALLGIDSNDVQYKIAQLIIDDGLNVRETEKIIKNYGKEKKKDKGKTIEPDIFIHDVRDRMEGFFGTKVNINNKKNKGIIEIEYYSEEDLQRIIEILNL